MGAELQSLSRDNLVSTCQLSIVVPCYNEEQVIGACHETLTRVLSPAIRDYQIVYVNDGSSDSTYELLREIQSADARVKVVDLARNFGHQVAVSAGLAHADGAAVALIDADLQDPRKLSCRWFNSGSKVTKWCSGSARRVPARAGSS